MFWLAVAGLAFLTASVVGGALGEARSLSERYGPLRAVVVAARPVERGVALAPADLDIRLVPRSFVPEGAFDGVDAVRGRTAVVPLLGGQTVLLGHLAPKGLSGVAALMPAGTRAVAVPAGGTAAPPLARGDVVDVLATIEDQPALAIANDAPVVDVGPDSVTVAVRPDEARSVAFALANGAVTVALTPGLSPGTAAQRNRVASTPSTPTPAATR